VVIALLILLTGLCWLGFAAVSAGMPSSATAEDGNRLASRLLPVLEDPRALYRKSPPHGRHHGVESDSGAYGQATVAHHSLRFSIGWMAATRDRRVRLDRHHLDPR
jgi:hypothetical protein